MISTRLTCGHTESLQERHIQPRVQIHQMILSPGNLSASVAKRVRREGLPSGVKSMARLLAPMAVQCQPVIVDAAAQRLVAF